MKILWFGIYNVDYPRNYILLNGLEKIGVEVIHCSVGAKERWRYFKLIRSLRKLRGQYDVVYAAFPAQSVVAIAKLFSGKPVVMDAFYSMFDSIVHDRELHAWYHPKALWMVLLDWTSVLMADMVITDTDQHAEYWGTWLGVNTKKFNTVPIGSDSKYFFPREANKADERFLVQYHGSYIPLQGMDIIVEAAAELKDCQDIRWRFIGSGQLFAESITKASELGATQIEYIERLPFKEMNAYLNEADVILGIFGQTAKADRVVPNKLYEGLAVGKPVISKRTRATTLLDESEIMFVERDAEQLSAAILELKNNPAKRKALAEAGYRGFQERFAATPIATTLVTHIKEAGIIK